MNSPLECHPGTTAVARYGGPDGSPTTAMTPLLTTDRVTESYPTHLNRPLAGTPTNPTGNGDKR